MKSARIAVVGNGGEDGGGSEWGWSRRVTGGRGKDSFGVLEASGRKSILDFTYISYSCFQFRNSRQATPPSLYLHVWWRRSTYRPPSPATSPVWEVRRPSDRPGGTTCASGGLDYFHNTQNGLVSILPSISEDILCRWLSIHGSIHNIRGGFKTVPRASLALRHTLLTHSTSKSDFSGGQWKIYKFVRIRDNKKYCEPFGRGRKCSRWVKEGTRSVGKRKTWPRAVP